MRRRTGSSWAITETLLLGSGTGGTKFGSGCINLLCAAAEVSNFEQTAALNGCRFIVKGTASTGSRQCQKLVSSGNTPKRP
jgi:hypothetical protein